MRPFRRQEGSVGNTAHKPLTSFPGDEIPIPWEEIDWAPEHGDCRAASNPAYGDTQVTQCAGEPTHSHLFQYSQAQLFGDFSTGSSRDKTLATENTHKPDLHRSDSFADFTSPDSEHGPLLGAPGPEVVSVQGGGKKTSTAVSAAKHTGKMDTSYASTTECILQNLTMAVGNPSARCFADAPWRAFTWTCALLQETNTQPWGNLKEAVQESLELAESVDIQQLPGLKPMWKKHDLNIEGDANRFVNALWNVSQSRAFHYRFAEIQPGGYLTDHMQPILVPFPDDWPEATSLQDLFNGWANTGLGQYLMDDKPVLVSHIARNTMVDSTPTKHSKILNTYGTFTVPRSLDGLARTSSEFVPAALICHRGPSHNAGHYFAILIYRDLMWIADDGKPPIHLEHLTPQLASKVTQVWAVHIDTFKTTQQVLRSLPPPEEPDYDPPLHPSPEKRPRHEQQHNKLHFANVTHFGRQVLDWYLVTPERGLRRGGEIFGPTATSTNVPVLHHRGRTAFGTPAMANDTNTGSHGGILVLADPSCGLTPLESYTNQGCGFQWQATDCAILVAGTYMKTGETLQSDTNATILARLLALVQATNHPFVLLGDWQNSPATITSTVLPSKFHFEVISPDCSLLSGNVIDYALIHTNLASATSLTTEWAIPWRPHALLTYHFNIEEAAKEYRQIQYFPPLPATSDIDFRPWTTYKSTAYELDLYGNPANDTAQKWADYLLQEHPWAAQGRGSSLRACHKPLAPCNTVTTWKRGRPAFWEQLKGRFQLALKQPPQQLRGPTKGFTQAIADVPKRWVGTPTWGQFLDTCHHWHKYSHWHKYRDGHAADLVRHTIDHQLQQAHQAANDENQLQYKAWLQH